MFHLLAFSLFCNFLFFFLKNVIFLKIFLLLILVFWCLFTRPQQFTFQDSNNSVDSSASDSDPMRQRFSIKAHSQLPYLVISDGYMVTTLRFLDSLSPSVHMRSLLLDSTQRLEKIYQSVILSKVQGFFISLGKVAFFFSNLKLYWQ